MRTNLLFRIYFVLGNLFISFAFGAVDDLKVALKTLGEKHAIVNTVDDIERLNKEIILYVESLETFHANQAEILNEIYFILQSKNINDYETVFSLPKFIRLKLPVQAIESIDDVLAQGDSRTKIFLIDFLGNCLPKSELIPILKSAMIDIDPEVRLKAIQTCSRRKLQELVPQLEEAFEYGGEFDDLIAIDASLPISLVEQILMECGDSQLSSPFLHKQARVIVEESGDSNIAMAARFFLCETETEAVARRYRNSLVEIASDTNHSFQARAIQFCSKCKTIPLETEALILEKALRSDKVWVSDTAVSSIALLSKRFPEYSPTLFKQAIETVTPDRLFPLFDDLDKVQLTPELVGALKLLLVGLKQNVNTHLSARRAIAKLMLSPYIEDDKLLELLRYLKDHAKSPSVTSTAEAALMSIMLGGRARIKRMRELESEFLKSTER